MSIRELIDPTNSTLIFIDHQPQMSFGSVDRSMPDVSCFDGAGRRI